MSRARPVNLLYVIDTLKVGGAQYHLLEVVRRLDRERFHPLVCCLGGDDVVAEEMRSEGIEPKILGLSRIHDGAALKALRPLARWIREGQVKLVHTYLNSANLYGAVAARLAGIRHIVTSRRDMGFSRNWRTFAFEQVVVNPMVRNVVTVCDAAGAQARREWFLGDDKVRTIPNGIDLGEIPVGRNGELADLRGRLGVQNTDVLIAIVASLTPVKGHDVLLQAASHVCRERDGVKFVLVGDGPLRGEHEARVRQANLENRVIFAGRCRREEALRILSAADLAVLASHTEGMSNVLLEYMAQSLPVIATGVGGNPEIVIDGQTGRLVPPGDADAMARALLELLGAPELAAQMGRAGRLRVETEFTTERMIGRMEALYDDVLGCAGRDA